MLLSLQYPIDRNHLVFLFMHVQKTTLQGLSLQDAKRGVSDFFLSERKSSFSSSHAKRGLEITARTAGASKTIEVEVDKPLGLTLGQKKGGGVVITVSFDSPSIIDMDFESILDFFFVNSGCRDGYLLIHCGF